ncbi:hypothetical protein CFP56_016658 [Quercus suber]|uniref:Uncharacterized protein n=1 Tax=Quercus suber TaxID=58331 RepID=A0AAW0KNE1_QUESU
MSRSAGESGLIQTPLSLGASDDVVDGSSSFKSPNTVEREIFGSNPSLSRSSTTRYLVSLQNPFEYAYDDSLCTPTDGNIDFQTIYGVLAGRT